jgi:hypothetical protein
MTVVLQRQFWDLEVEDDCFAVTLKFSGTPQRIAVPFDALTAFADPCAEFGLRFQQLEEDLAQASVESSEDDGTDGEDPDVQREPAAVTGRNGNVVQIEDFRRS